MGASMTRKELAKLTGYTYHRLYDIDRALPEEKKLFVASEGNKIDLAIFVQRWVDYNVERARGDKLNYDQMRAEHERAKLRKTELQVQQMEGELILVRDVRRLWGNVIDSARKALLRLPNQVSPRLLMMEKAEQVAEILDVEIRRALQQIADTPLPGHVTDREDE